MDAIIFDLFGTLVPKWPKAKSEANKLEMASLLGIEPERFEPAWRASFEARETGRHATFADALLAICDALDHEAHPDALAKAARARAELNRDALVPRTGTLDVLRAARDGGWKVGLISNCGPNAPELWPETPMAEFFHATCFSAVEGVIKPDAEIYRRAIERLGVAADRCVYVGDGGAGELTAAQSLGMRAVLIHDPNDRGSTGPGDESASWAGERVTSMSGLLPIVCR